MNCKNVTPMTIQNDATNDLDTSDLMARHQLYCRLRSYGAYGIGGFGVPVGFRKSYRILPVAKRVKAPTGVRREQASTGRG